VRDHTHESSVSCEQEHNVKSQWFYYMYMASTTVATNEHEEHSLVQGDVSASVADFAVVADIESPVVADDFPQSQVRIGGDDVGNSSSESTIHEDVALMEEGFIDVQKKNLESRGITDNEPKDKLRPHAVNTGETKAAVDELCKDTSLESYCSGCVFDSADSDYEAFKQEHRTARVAREANVEDLLQNEEDIEMGLKTRHFSFSSLSNIEVESGVSDIPRSANGSQSARSRCSQKEMFASRRRKLLLFFLIAILAIAVIVAGIIAGNQNKDKEGGGVMQEAEMIDADGGVSEGSNDQSVEPSGEGDDTETSEEEDDTETVSKGPWEWDWPDAAVAAKDTSDSPISPQLGTESLESAGKRWSSNALKMEKEP